MPNAVIFDLDGTLLDTIPDIAGALNRSLAACGLPTHPVEACKAFVGGGIMEAIRMAAPAGTDQETLRRVHQAYQEDYPAHCAVDTVPYPGVEALLEGLSARGVALGILSNKTEGTTIKIIETYFPQTEFRCVFGRVPERPIKPDPAAAAPVLEALGLPASEMAYVGDSGTDMAFAKAVGMLPVGAPWGYRSREQLLEQGAVLLPESPAQLLSLL